MKELVETTLVTPSEETNRQELWLSNLDLQFRHVYPTVLSYYPAQQGGTCFDSERLKLALAKALVPFYPLAGRLSLGEDDRRYVDCNGEGVQFVVVRADATGEEFFKDDYGTSPDVTEMFVPALPPEELPCIVGLFQVTLLKCGGMVLTSSFHHAVVDGTGIFHFMQTWSRLARGLNAAEAIGPELPFHDRTSIRLPSPPGPANVVDVTNCPRFVAHSYPFPFKLIDQLKSRCGGASTFYAVAAHIWQCMCLARRLAATDSDNTRLIMPVNVRRRLRPPLPHSFSGNAVLHASATAPVGDVVDDSPGIVVEKVRDAVGSVDDVVLGCQHEVKPTTKSEMVMIMVCWLEMPVYDADFGWGMPKLVMPSGKFLSGMVFLLPRGNDKESGITALVTLEPEYLPGFEKLLYDVV